MKLRTFIHTANSNATCVGWLSADQLISGGYDYTTKSWNANTGERTFIGGQHPAGIEVSRCRNGQPYIGRADGAILWLDGSISTGFGRITEIAVSAERIAVGCSKLEGGLAIPRIAVYSSNGTLLWARIASGAVYGLAFSTDGEVLYVGEGQPSGGILYKRSAITGNVLSSRMAASEAITDLAVHGSELAVAQANTGQHVVCVRYCSASDLQQYAGLARSFPSGVWTIGYNCIGQLVGIGDMDRNIVIVDRTSGSVVYQSARPSLVKQIAWHPTNPTLFAVALSHGVIELHDLVAEPAPTPAPAPTPTKPRGKKN